MRASCYRIRQRNPQIDKWHDHDKPASSRGEHSASESILSSSGIASQKTKIGMGNTTSALKEKHFRDAPLAFVQKADRESTGRIHHSMDSIGSSTFGSTVRTAPIQGRNSAKSLVRSKSQDAVMFWPFHLEEQYAFEEVFDQVSIPFKSKQYDVAHLEADLDIQRNILAAVAHKKGYINKKRVGIKRRERLSALPDSICDGVNADLSDQGIVSLTAHLGIFKHLVSLNLQGNKLATLPDEIGLLKCLKELNVSENRLQSLPESIGLLQRVREVNLKGNELYTLPESFGNLRRLKVLNICHNKFRIVPRCVGNLAKLCTFEADRNMIEYLPAEMSLLKQLCRIQLFGNPLVKEEYILTKAKLASSGGGPITLLETAARMIIRDDQEVLRNMPLPLKSFLKSAEKCSFCHGPYLNSYYGRIRLLERQGQVIPFIHYLCSSHWSNEKGRLRAMFEVPPQTTPKTVLTMRRSRSNTAISTVRTRARTSTAERIRLNQLLGSDGSSPESPQYYRINSGPQIGETTDKEGSLIDVRLLPDPLDYGGGIAVARSWLEIPTEVLYCHDESG